MAMKTYNVYHNGDLLFSDVSRDEVRRLRKLVKDLTIVRHRCPMDEVVKWEAAACVLLCSVLCLMGLIAGGILALTQ